jgi:hypothetical protein
LLPKRGQRVSVRGRGRRNSIAADSAGNPKGNLFGVKRGEKPAGENGGAAELHASVLLDHDFGRLDDNTHAIALLELKLFRAGAGDHTFQEVVTYADVHVGHDIADVQLLDGSGELVARGEWHAAS